MYRIQKQEKTEPTARMLENMQAPNAVWQRLKRRTQEYQEKHKKKNSRYQENVIYTGLTYCKTKKETAEAEEDTVVAQLDGRRGTCLYNRVPYIPSKKNCHHALSRSKAGVKYLVVAPRKLNVGARHQKSSVETKGIKVPQPIQVKGLIPTSQQEFLDSKTEINPDVWPFLELYGVKKEDLEKLEVEDLKVHEEWSFGKQLKVEAEDVLKKFKSKKKEEKYEEKCIKVEHVLDAFKKTPFPALDKALKNRRIKRLRDDYSCRVQQEVLNWMKRMSGQVDVQNSYWNSWEEQTKPMFMASFEYNWYAFFPNDPEYSLKLQDFYDSPKKIIPNHSNMANVKRWRSSPDTAWRCKNLGNKCCCCAPSGPVRHVITKEKLKLKFRMTCQSRTGMWNSF